MILFDGKKIAFKKEEKLKLKVGELLKKGIVPKLVSIMIGENPESEVYLRLKGEAAERVGIKLEVVRFSEEVKSKKVIKYIEKLNKDPKVHGIMIQMPLPEKSSVASYQSSVLSAIEPSKDIDCLTPQNLGLLMMGKPRFCPAVVKAVIEIIENLRGQHVCVVGASNLVGKPLAMMLLSLGATVTICQDTTKNLCEFTKKADILISATGVPGLIKKEMVKPEAVLIDVGEKRVGNKVLGDVDKKIKEVASFLTPVPGGVGPVTVVCLLENLIEVLSIN